MESQPTDDSTEAWEVPGTGSSWEFGSDVLGRAQGKVPASVLRVRVTVRSGRNSGEGSSQKVH